MNFMPLLILAVALNAGATFADIWLMNLTNPDNPQYGASAFLPTGPTGVDDDDLHPYNRAVNFLLPMNEDGQLTGIQGPPDTGIIDFISWALKAPICYTSGAISVIVGYATFSYSVVDIIPSDGWAGWVKTLIYLIGSLVTLAALVQVVGFVVSSGILQSQSMLIALGVIGSVGAAANFLVGVGVVGC